MSTHGYSDRAPASKIWPTRNHRRVPGPPYTRNRLEILIENYSTSGISTQL